MSAPDLPAMLPELLPKLWAFAFRITRDRHDAEDLVQRACLRALERKHQLRPGSSPLSWLYSIVHSTWMNELRARRVRGRTSADWDDTYLETVADPSACNPEVEILNQQIVREIGRLPEAQRVVMLLIAVEGLSYLEAADVLGVPVGTIMSRLSRARQAVGNQFLREKTRIKYHTEAHSITS